MSDQRHGDALDRLDRRATTALDLFFGTPVPDRSTEPADSRDEAPLPPVLNVEPPHPVKRRRTTHQTPAMPPRTPVEAPPGEIVGTEPLRLVETPTAAPEPMLPSVLRTGYVTVATGISQSADDTLHLAAYAAGGEKEKSRLVREAVGALISAFDAAPPTEQERLREEMRRSTLDGRISRIYRLEPATRERLTGFARDERIPVAAVLRAAIERHYGSSLREMVEPAD